MSESVAVGATPSPVRRKLLSFTIVVMGVLFLGRVLGLARDLIVAPLFGASIEVDALVAARTIPELVLAVVAGGAIRAAVVPSLSFLSREGRDELSAWRAVSTATNWLIALVSLIALLGLAFPWQSIGLVAPGLDDARRLLASRLLIIMLPTAVLQVVGAVLAAMLNYRDRFAIPGMTAASINGSIIVLTLIFWQKLGVLAVALGWLVGVMLHLLIQIPLAIRSRVHYRLAFDFRAPGVRYSLVLMVPVMLSQVLLNSRFIIERQFASWLPTGTLALLNYAFRISILPYNILTGSVITVYLPAFSRWAASKNNSRFIGSLAQALRLTLLGIVPCAVVFIGLPAPTVKLLLERGAFRASDTALAASMLVWYGVALVADSVFVVLSQAFYAMRGGKFPMLAILGGILAQVATSLLVVPLVEAPGLALATCMGMIVSLVLIIVMLRNKLGGVSIRWWRSYLVRINVAGLGMLLTCTIMYKVLGTFLPNLSWLVSYVFALLLGITIYLLAVWRLKIPECNFALARMRMILRGVFGVAGPSVPHSNEFPSDMGVT